LPLAPPRQISKGMTDMSLCFLFFGKNLKLRL
jgi:hypothetical protein